MKEEARRLLQRYVTAQARIAVSPRTARMKDSVDALDDLDAYITKLECADKVPTFSAREYLLEFSRRGSVPMSLTLEAREPKDEDSALYFLITHHIKLWSEHAHREQKLKDLNRFQRFLLWFGRIKL